MSFVTASPAEAGISSGVLNAIWQTVKEEMSDLGDVQSVTRVVVRLTVAAVLGGILGFEREASGKSAGLRTHMLVALGSAMFVLVPEQAGIVKTDISRVLQGLVAGVGFLGAGAIIHNSRHKDDEDKDEQKTDSTRNEVKGLTTAAGIWMTAAIGMAAGMGREVTAALSTVLALLVLAVIPKFVDLWPTKKDKRTKIG